MFHPVRGLSYCGALPPLPSVIYTVLSLVFPRGLTTTKHTGGGAREDWRDLDWAEGSVGGEAIWEWEGWWNEVDSINLCTCMIAGMG